MSTAFSGKKHQIVAFFVLVACKCSHQTAVKYWIVLQPLHHPLNACSIKGRFVDVAENMRRISWQATKFMTYFRHTRIPDRQTSRPDGPQLKNSETEVLGKIVHFGFIKAGRMTYNLYSNSRVVGYFKYDTVRSAPKQMQRNLKWQRSFNKRIS